MQSVLNAFVPTGRRQPRRPLHLGAVKANVGHAESASGVSALIKVLMMVQRSEIPPHVGIKIKVNRNYPHDLAERNVHIDLKATPWRRADCPGGKRISFLNNFSAAGGNTALLLEDAPMPHSEEEVDGLRPLHAVALSGKGPKSLESNLAKLLESLQQNPRTSLPALSYTTTARRAHYKFRVMSVGADRLPSLTIFGHTLGDQTSKLFLLKLRRSLGSSLVKAAYTPALGNDSSSAFLTSGRTSCTTTALLDGKDLLASWNSLYSRTPMRSWMLWKRLPLIWH